MRDAEYKKLCEKRYTTTEPVWDTSCLEYLIIPESYDSIEKAIQDGRIWSSGGKHFSVCANCGKIVRLDKPGIGSLHFCC